ncbi:uncharacterized protein FMAN_03749 [Fusarium mangiferae]|uniref:Uncharacterized protein n=1 Tax=Fusarium mangiferae TaxID=192010 RepID=A0A1L7U6D2_FUSMA|nr:uncharacterized protein FMAN_03749 [Fusarium mangiferae]CVL06330.1 uncharacterized protein FMAN_03749 [Fusarium mangiferae]
MTVIHTLEAKALAKDEAHRKKLEEEVERRKAQEQDRSRGENVWFSRRIKDGHLYHWALFVYGKKYELRLPSRQKYKSLPKGHLVGSLVPSIRYESKIAPWSMQDEMMRLRQESLDSEGKPYAQDYYICQIGWTKMSEKRVDEECEAAHKSFGVYVLGFNDCQSFLRQFAKRIIKQPEDCALDFPWFEKNIQTAYHELQLIAADENIKAFQFYMRTVLYGTAGATVAGAGSAYEHQYQSQEPMTKANGSKEGAKKDDDDDGCCDCDGCGC